MISCWLESNNTICQKARWSSFCVFATRSGQVVTATDNIYTL